MTNIVCKRLNKTYKGGSCALDGLNLQIADREFAVLLGESGCGKTTLLRVICGIEDLDGGELLRDGQRINDLLPSKRNMALLSQNYALYPHLSVYENMAFPLVVQKVSNTEIKRRVDAVAEQLELTDLLVRKPKQLSGGQQQRVALGRAIVRKPDLLLLDEPLSNLDVKLRTKIRILIETLVRENGITCLYVTHDQAEAMAIADKIAIMDKGKIIQCDTPDTLCNFPSNKFVATFLNADKINMLDCVTSAQGKSVQLTNGFEVPLPVNKQFLLHSALPTSLSIHSKDIQIGDSGIEATIDSMVLLGNKQKFTLSSQDLSSITALCDHTCDYVEGEKVKFSLDADKVCLYDCNGDNIFAPQQENYLPCTLSGNHLLYEQTHFLLPDDFANTLFDFAREKCVKMGIDSSKVYLKMLDNALPLQLVADFSIEYGNQWLAYCKKGEEYFVFTADRHLKSGEQVTVYVPLSALSLYDGEGNRLNSFRIYPNSAKCSLKTVGDVTHIKVGNARLVYPAMQGIVDGDAQITLLSNKLRLAQVYDGAKKRKALFTENILEASAYDEDNLGNSNAVFVKIDGWDNYVTVVLQDKFSVYDTPRFDLYVPQDAFILNQQ